jgi:hypothetical protein
MSFEYRIIAYVICSLVLAAAGAFGWHEFTGHYIQEGKDIEHAIQAKEIAVLNEKIDRIQSEKAAAGSKAETKYVYRDRQIELEGAQLEERVHAWIAQNPDRIVCGIDDDGLRLWNEANNRAGATVQPPAKPDSSVPPTAPRTRWDSGIVGDKPRTSDGSVPALPSPAASLGRMGGESLQYA